MCAVNHRARCARGCNDGNTWLTQLSFICSALAERFVVRSRIVVVLSPPPKSPVLREALTAGPGDLHSCNTHLGLSPHLHLIDSRPRSPVSRAATKTRALAHAVPPSTRLTECSAAPLQPVPIACTSPTRMRDDAARHPTYWTGIAFQHPPQLQ